MQICWKVTDSVLPVYCSCFLGGVSLHMTKRLCSKSARIVEFSQDTDPFAFMGHT